MFTQPTNTANLQSRSHLLPNIQQFRPSILQSPLINQQTQFLSQHHQPITWAPNSPFILPTQQSDGQFLFHTPGLTPIYIPSSSTSNQQQQTKTEAAVQLVVQQATNDQLLNKNKPIKATTSCIQKDAVIDNASTTSTKDKKDEDEKLAKHLAVQQTKKQKKSVLKYKKAISDKILNNQQAKKLKLILKPNHKSTKQMNDELLARINAENCNKLAANEESLSDNSSKDGLKSKKKLKLEKNKKKVSIVKPRVVLTHNVNGQLVYESDKAFSIDSFENEFDEDILVDAKINLDENEVNKSKDVKKRKKHKKQQLKSKSVTLNSKIQSSSNDQSLDNLPTLLIKLDTIASDTLVELSDSVSEESSSSKVSTLSKEAQVANKDIYKWSIEDAFKFALETTSNSEFANTLKQEQFDGYSLTLLTIQILKDAYKLKLGPILLLKKKIDELKLKSNEDRLIADCLSIIANNANIHKWSVKETFEFILALTSKEIAAEFERQEMDGHSLTLISCDNIRNDLNISYGQALKIISVIDKLKVSARK